MPLAAVVRYPLPLLMPKFTSPVVSDLAVVVPVSPPKLMVLPTAVAVSFTLLFVVESRPTVKVWPFIFVVIPLAPATFRDWFFKFTVPLFVPSVTVRFCELTAVLMAEATLLASARPVPADAVVPFIVIFCILGVIVRFLPAADVLIYVLSPLMPRVLCAKFTSLVPVFPAKPRLTDFN